MAQEIFEVIFKPFLNEWMARGGPLTMTISGKNTVVVNDVLIGEDWIGSGQSNMALTISKKAASFAGMLDEDKEIAAANYSQLRIFMAVANKTYEPQTEIKGEWKIATPENAPAFSAVAYLFGRDLNQAIKEPVGMIVVAFGASTAESWVSRPIISGDPEIKPLLDHFDELYNFYRSHPNATTDQAPPSPQKGTDQGSAGTTRSLPSRHSSQDLCACPGRFGRRSCSHPQWWSRRSFDEVGRRVSGCIFRGCLPIGSQTAARGS